MFFDSSPVHPYASFWLDVGDKAIKALAVAIGGIWTYVNYLRSRTYKRKIEIGVEGKLFEAMGNQYGLINCRLRNVGQSKDPIEQKGTALEVLALTPDGRQKLHTCCIFGDHAWIEPGEQIEEPVIVPMPDPQSVVAFLLNLRVVAAKIEWNSSSVIRPAENQKEIAHEISGSK